LCSGSNHNQHAPIYTPGDTRWHQLELGWPGLPPCAKREATWLHLHLQQKLCSAGPPRDQAAAVPVIKQPGCSLVSIRAGEPGGCRCARMRAWIGADLPSPQCRKPNGTEGSVAQPMKDESRASGEWHARPAGVTPDQGNKIEAPRASRTIRSAGTTKSTPAAVAPTHTARAPTSDWRNGGRAVETPAAVRRRA
jgi:hypothetical protein